MSNAPASYFLHLPSSIARSRVERVFCASTDMSKIHLVSTAEELFDVPEPRGIITHDSTLKDAEMLALTRPDLRQAIMCSDRYDAAFQAMKENEQIQHLVNWPDFLTTPRSWDIMCVSKCFSPQGSLHWTQFLPGGSAHRKWGLYSSFDRDMVIENITELVRTQLSQERLADSVAEVAYEMAMNAMYDAPVDEFGRAKYSHDRQADIALDDDEVPSLEFATDGSTIALQVDDPFGRLRRYDVLEGIGRGLNARHAQAAQDVLNTSQGGAGLGLFRMFQLSTSLMFDVLKSKHTRVIALFDMGMRLKDRRNDLTSIHLYFHRE